VPLELAELAAGLPIAASFAMAGGISALREGRRRTALNEAVHELRRPLQAIALSTPASGDRAEAFESSLRMAAAAVDRLDAEINGSSAPEPIGTVPLRQVVEAAVVRWQIRASLEARALSLEWEAGDVFLRGDEVQLAQVMDNVISNGLDHGSGEVAVEAKRVGGVIRLLVANRKEANPPGWRQRAWRFGARMSGRCRHGHGLRIARRVAAQSGGSFHFREQGDRCEAVFQLPLAGGLR
jgi:signal transduction histidine kinase